MMEKRIFDSIQKEVSLLGFGCMRLPKQGDDIDREQTQAMVDLAIASGVNYFDTAYMYHEGESELVIGEALKKHPRDSFMLADKMPVWLVRSPADIDRIFFEQLDKCGVEYFDFYLLHALDKKRWKIAKMHGIYERLAELKKLGKIKHLGFSFHDSPDVLEEIASAHQWDFAQIQLNYLDWDDINAARQYEILKSKNIPAIIMEPVRGGALATLNPQSEAILKKADGSKSNASWALRFAMSLDGVLTVLSGMSNLDHVSDNIATATNFEPLKDKDYQTLQEAATMYRKFGSIPCTGCKYCIDCPSKVNIPSIFSIYNNYTVTQNHINFIYCYKSLGAEQGSSCIACKACHSKCPQHIDIVSELAKIDDLYKELTKK